MVFNKDIPQPNDQLSASQPTLLSNNLDLDTSFGVDHYAFSDATSNNGKHREVTSPNIAIPTTTVDPKIYGYEKTTILGTMQFSRGINNAVPTPITAINSTEAVADRVFLAGDTKPILDCTGMSRTIMTIKIDSIEPDSPLISALYSATFSNGVLSPPKPLSPITSLRIEAAGNVLQARNNTSNLSHVYWTIQFLRLE